MIEVTDASLQKAAGEGMDEFIQVFTDKYKEVQAVFPDNEIVMQPLSLSIACHIGPGALAIACSKKIEA